MINFLRKLFGRAKSIESDPISSFFGLFKKNWVWLFLSLFVVTLLLVLFRYVYVTADPPGYCREQQRYIADEEFIKVSVALLDWQINSTVVRPDGTSIKYREHYLNREEWERSWLNNWELNRNNLNCCYVDRTDTYSILSRVFNQQTVEARLIYNPKSRGDSYTPFTFNICGKLLRSGVSLPIRKSSQKHKREEITTTNYLKAIKNK